MTITFITAFVRNSNIYHKLLRVPFKVILNDIDILRDKKTF